MFHRTNLIVELLAYPREKFLQHLELEDNNRILFSGKFGMGKSVFLEYFFNGTKETNTPPTNYTVFHLYPVNYSISSNEDIYRYIKYDLIISMLQKKSM